MDLELAGRVVLVVGGTGLIGRAVAERLRAEGATVVTAARGAEADVQLDASDDTSVAAGLQQILTQHRRLDGVVVSAAPSAQTLDVALNGDPAQVAAAFEAKAMSFLRVARAVLPVMREAGFGRIVGLSGQNAFVTGNITGSVRNAALIIAAKSLADEAAGTGVTVNSVSPGTVTAEPSREVVIGRGGESTPTQVADLVAFLLSPRSAVSGETIAVGHRVRGVVSF
jgi:NAD(P)-dependent dehydrogenase (short-subunit alcohol dehydrogenase family)